MSKTTVAINGYGVIDKVKAPVSTGRYPLAHEQEARHDPHSPGRIRLRDPAV